MSARTPRRAAPWSASCRGLPLRTVQSAGQAAQSGGHRVRSSIKTWEEVNPIINKEGLTRHFVSLSSVW